MRSTRNKRRWAALGAAAVLATAAFALPALAQQGDGTGDSATSDPAEAAEPGARHAELLEELEGLDADAVIERLEELHAEREAARAERFAERQTWRAERFAERQEQRDARHAEVLAELEGLEGEELTAKLEELHEQWREARAERRADREALRGQWQEFRAERQAEHGQPGALGFGPPLGGHGHGPLASE